MSCRVGASDARGRETWYGDGMTHREKNALEVLRRTVERRRLFHKVFSEEVLEELQHLFGLDKRVFAFRVGPDGKYDPLDAMRDDTLRGVIASLRWEADAAQLQEAEKLMQEALAAAKEEYFEPDGEVEHA